MKYFFNDIPITIREWLKIAVHIAGKPILLVASSYFVYLSISYISIYFPQLLGETKTFTFAILRSTVRIIELCAFFWFIFRALNFSKLKIQAWINTTRHQTFRIIFPIINNSLQVAIVILMINLIIPELDLSSFQAEFLEKLANILLISALGWFFIQMVNGIEKIILYQYAIDHIHEVSVRKIRTQTKLLKKIILTIGLIVIISAILMVFDSVKQLGLGLLTTAGVISAMGAFASQQSLGRLFAGLQIAFTQPIRIGDMVIIEKEFGEIEEISLSYVVIKLWDLRRLILPTDYFTGKGFQNLTKTSTELLGTVFLYVDHTFPIDNLRTAFQQILADSPNWDKKTGILHVTDMKEHTTELRLLVSAQNASTLWNLRCEVREKLIKFISQHYSIYLPKLRNINVILKNGN